MTIKFYIDNEEETELFSLYEQFVAPFKVGEKIMLRVDDLYPKDYTKGNNKYNKQIHEENNNLKSVCHLKTAKIIRMRNYADITALENRITVEYHCKILDE